MSEPRGGEKGRKFVEELEHRNERVKSLLDEIERQRHKAERQGPNFTTPTAVQLENELHRTEISKVAA